MMNGQKNDPQLLTQGIELVDNVDTMKLKVEFNDGYALADSQYFSYSDGDMLLLPGYEGECVIKAFYRKKRNKKKVKEILEAKAHTSEGVTALPNGLVLVKIDYK